MMLRITALALLALFFLLLAPAHPFEAIAERDYHSCWAPAGKFYSTCREVIGDAWREI